MTGEHRSTVRRAPSRRPGDREPLDPLTARVLVNRVWQETFGTGFVPTPDDLGNQSAPPTNPELLDYLASRFVEEGWSIKKLQRLIMLSSVYQESSAGNPKYADTDPDNRLQTTPAMWLPGASLSTHAYRNSRRRAKIQPAKPN